MTNNVSAVWDRSHNFSMWVELFNPGNTSINQSIYFFTDDLSQPRKWQPPGVFVPARGYNILYFERPRSTGHSTFRLEPEGGRLFMLNAAGVIIDFVVYPAQKRNISYGRRVDGADEWVFFEEFSPGTTNNGRRWASVRCSNPRFTVPGGLYATGVNIRFENPAPGDTIFYVFGSEEPTRTNAIRYTPGNTISITSTTTVRARAFGAGKLPSDVVTSSYLIGQRNFALPVVSIVTPQAFLTDNTIGIYVRGTNGIPGNGTEQPANWNQDWDRPANIEIFDTSNRVVINQELDISIGGGWSRTMNPQKSLHIKPKLKFGNNRLYYDFFAATKPNRRYKDIFLRNSGNDFGYSMLRDAFMQSLVIKRMDIDALAYEPAICFINGTYFGIQNLRERSNEDFLFSNYGLREDEVIILDHLEMQTNPEYQQMINFITNNDITNATVYNQLTEMMDVSSYINYMITQIFVGNYDWPHNNVKVWRKINGGKWRWILFDLDFGFNLYDTNLHNFNSLTYALGEPSSRSTQDWATAFFRRLVLNSTFREQLINRFVIHLSSTFETNRVNHVLDSLAARISHEIGHHKNRWGSSRAFNADITNMKTFSANRPNNMFGYISNRFMNGATTQTIQISSNNPRATYTMNAELIQDASINLRSFRGRIHQFRANPIPGFDFKHWELANASSTHTRIAYDSEWRFWDLFGMPASNWTQPEYNDSGWRSGQAILGYGHESVRTTIGFGANANNKHPTAYFRRSINIENPESLSNIVLTVFADDGAAVYVNGTEVGRFNLPTGPLAFNTLTTTWNNGEFVSFNVPASLLRRGVNVIAAEVHQTSVTSSDLMFNLQLIADGPSESAIVRNAVYSTNMTSNLQIRAIYEENNLPNPAANTSIAINEIVSSNSIVPNPFGNTEDYIELYNYGDVPINIAGWFISDDANNSLKTRIPTTDSATTLIPPKGYLVLWADSSPHLGVLHAGFNLNREGETVLLSVEDKFGKLHLVDSIRFPAMERNMSFSRLPDGTGNWVVQPMTMGGSNQLTDLPEQPTSNVRVYPTDVLYDLFISGAAGKKIRISDLTGKVLIDEFAWENNHRINLRLLQRGIYLVTIEQETFRIIRR